MFLIFFHFSCFQGTGIARVRSRSDKIVRLSRRNDLLENTQRTRWIAKLAAIQKLPSGNWRALVRRRGIFKSDRLRRRKDVEQLAIETESRVDRGECGSTKCVNKRSTFGNLIDIHIVDTHEVNKSRRHSKTNSINRLKEKLGEVLFDKLRRENPIEYGRSRFREGSASFTLSSKLSYISTVITHAATRARLIALQPIKGLRVKRQQTWVSGRSCNGPTKLSRS